MDLLLPNLSEVLESDNQRLVNFLNTANSILLSSKDISIGTSENFKRTIATLEEEGQLDRTPLLLQLIEDENEFLSALLFRWGSKSFCCNVFKYAMRWQLVEIYEKINEIGINIISKSKQKFNQDIYYFVGDSRDKKLLFSTLLTHIAEKIDLTLSNIERIDRCLASLTPNQMEYNGDHENQVDLQFAQSLGFFEINRLAIPLEESDHFKNLFLHEIENLLVFLQRATLQIVKNQKSSSSLEVDILFESMQMECSKIRQINLNRYESLTAIELRRLQITHAMHSLASAFGQLNTVLNSRILGFVSAQPSPVHSQASLAKAASGQEKQPRSFVTNAVIRKIAYRMIGEGVNAHNAAKASQWLKGYCEKENLSPFEIMAGEIKKQAGKQVSPAAINAIVAVLESEKKSDGLKQTDEKRDNLVKITSLGEKFNQFTKRNQTFLSALCISILTVFASCGIKKPPSSYEDDFRPTLPFQEQATQRPPTLQNAPTSPAQPSATSSQTDSANRLSPLNGNAEDGAIKTKQQIKQHKGKE